MRLSAVALALFAAAGLGCYRPPPGSPLEAAENFKSTVFELVGADDAQTARLNRLSIGMSSKDVIAEAGAPTDRETKTTDDGGAQEVWTYDGKLAILGTLTFENDKLTAMQTGGPPPTPSNP